MMPNSSRHPGLDYLRVLAIVLVTTQHVMTVIGLESWVWHYGMSVGEFGTAIFFALSGHLSMTTRRSPGDWLIKRIRHIYPAYWIVTFAAFILAATSGYKQFTAWQFMSQLLGLGYFSHGTERLVNVATWFVSVILICYVIAAFARATGKPLIVLATCLVCVGAYLYIYPPEPLNKPRLAFSLIEFGVPALATQLPGRWRWGGPLVLAPILIACHSIEPHLTTSGSVILIFTSTLAVNWPASRIAQSIADYIYEYFLVHGIAIAGCVTVMPNHPWLAVTIGVIISTLAAWLLHCVTSRLNPKAVQLV